MNLVSIIIPVHNDFKILKDCIESIQKTITIDYEIIIVNDFSSEEINWNCFDGYVKVIHNKKRIGVGASFDVGVKSSKGDILFLSGADIIQFDNNWYSILFEDVLNNPRSLICTECRSARYDYNEKEYKSVKRNYFGADMYIKMFHYNLPMKSRLIQKDNWRGAFEAKWRPMNIDGLYSVPCILGAFYAVNKSWYDYIGGFKNHKIWGHLEPYISLKSWMLGGDCKVRSNLYTSHIFSRNPNRKDDLVSFNYNSYMIANTLFDEDKVIDIELHLGRNEILKKARKLFLENKDSIFNERNRLKNDLMPYGDYIRKISEISIINPNF